MLGFITDLFTTKPLSTPLPLKMRNEIKARLDDAGVKHSTWHTFWDDGWQWQVFSVPRSQVDLANSVLRQVERGH